MRQVSILLARFPYQNQECPDSVDWFMKTLISARSDPRISEVFTCREDDTPITMTRNKVVEKAKRQGVDYLLLLDSDMAPDLPGEDSFWPQALDLALSESQPCIVAAPYAGPPPHSHVYVFRWTSPNNGYHNGDARAIGGLEMYSREEASSKRGVEEVAALPTGLMLIDTRIFAKLKPPYFYYEWTDETQSEKASTEDVTFTRDASLAGFPLYCLWGAWAGHWKRWRADRPRILGPSAVGRQLRQAILSDVRGTKNLPKQEMLVQIRYPKEFFPCPNGPVNPALRGVDGPPDPANGSFCATTVALPKLSFKELG